MKILIVSEMSPPYSIGGGEVRYEMLSRELACRGHEVTWVSMHQQASPSEEWRDGVRHLHLGPRIAAPPLRPLYAMLWFMLAVFAFVLRERFDVVDCQTYAPLPAAWLACKMTRTPMVATIHDVSTRGGAADDQWLSRRDRILAVLAEKLLYRLPYRRIITVSENVGSVLRDVMGVKPERIRVVPNAVEAGPIQSVVPESSSCDLIFVGRLVPHKHPEDFLTVLDLLNRRATASGRRPFGAKIVGGGPLEIGLREEIARRGLSTAVDLVGPLVGHFEVIAYVKAAQLLILPSTREGFGLVLVEAMACGALLAAYDIPAVRETVGPGLAPNLVPPRDTHALAHVVWNLLHDQDLARAQRMYGKQRVTSQYAPTRFAGDVEAVYQEILRRC